MPSSIAEGFVLKSMTEMAAREIAGWQYGGEYARYNTDPEDVEGAVRDFLDPSLDYWAVWHPDYGLAGFCCYGVEAHVPGGDYTESAIDVGLGLRPDLMGRGLGRWVLDAVMAERADEGLPFRATVAAYTGRSRRLFEKAGFVEEHSFTGDALAVEGGRLSFAVLVRHVRSDDTVDQIQEQAR